MVRKRYHPQMVSSANASHLIVRAGILDSMTLLGHISVKIHTNVLDSVRYRMRVHFLLHVPKQILMQTPTLTLNVKP